jgi:16S rRNA (adenine1518-N6/adenine1519-N6)-dimethyltransferase
MDLIPKKSLGQHFLNSRHVLEQIIAAAQIKKGEKILEIGPGTGILTKELLDAGARVTAVEKDQRAYGFLQGMFSREIEEGRLELIQGDILDAALPFTLTLNPSSFAIVANIPYYITGAILERFLEHGPQPDRMVLLVQKEVADRIVAREGKESILSISVKAFGTPEIMAKVPPGAFTPPPSVDSAILAIKNISNAHFSSDKAPSEEKSGLIGRFFEIVRSGFAHKRKYLKRNLESVLKKEQLDDIWQELGLDVKARAEDLTPGQWLSIAHASKKQI